MADGGRLEDATGRRGARSAAGLLYLHGAGWQAHLEHLGQSLTSGVLVHPDGWSSARQSPVWQQRWDELSPTYRAMALSEG